MIEGYEKTVDEWFKQAKWRENPFTLRIDPSLFVGYNKQLENLTRHVKEGQKAALVVGSTGSGKTTLALLLRNEFSREYDVIYLSKPPKTDEIVDVFTDKFRPSLLARLVRQKVSIHDLADYVNKRSKKGLLVMVDEIHEADKEVLEWIRTLTDHIGNMRLIMSGLPTTDEFLRKNLETLRNRVTTRVELNSLSESETSDFIRKRIESVGGKGIEPFDEEIVRQIHTKTGGFPREILRLCNNLIDRQIDGEDMEVREEVVEEQVEIEKPTQKSENSVRLDKNFIRDLPSKQRRILKILSESEDMYPSEIAEIIGLQKYKTKQHAVRSMNNILQRLMSDGYVQRKERGKGFVYFLEPKVRSLLTEA